MAIHRKLDLSDCNEGYDPFSTGPFVSAALRAGILVASSCLAIASAHGSEALTNLTPNLLDSTINTSEFNTACPSCTHLTDYSGKPMNEAAMADVLAVTSDFPSDESQVQSQAIIASKLDTATTAEPARSGKVSVNTELPRR